MLFWTLVALLYLAYLVLYVFVIVWLRSEYRLDHTRHRPPRNKNGGTR